MDILLWKKNILCDNLKVKIILLFIISFSLQLFAQSRFSIRTVFGTNYSADKIDGETFTAFESENSWIDYQYKRKREHMRGYCFGIETAYRIKKMQLLFGYNLRDHINHGVVKYDVIKNHIHVGTNYQGRLDINIVKTMLYVGTEVDLHNSAKHNLSVKLYLEKSLTNEAVKSYLIRDKVDTFKGIYPLYPWLPNEGLLWYVEQFYMNVYFGYSTKQRGHWNFSPNLGVTWGNPWYNLLPIRVNISNFSLNNRIAGLHRFYSINFSIKYTL